MKKKILTTILSLLALLILPGCERDDICPRESPTTPQLVIRFYNTLDPDELKSVTRLKVIAQNEDVSETVPGLNRITIDSIAIPLRSFNTETSFIFIEESADDEDGIETGNRDTISFSYTPQEVFISRGCGYSINYLGLNYTLSDDTNNWINNVLIEIPNLVNQNQAHVKIFH